MRRDNGTSSKVRANQVRAVEHIRRMRGGTQSHLMRCSDGNYYVVKVQNNPQGIRSLVNDLVGSLLAGLLNLSVAEPAIVHLDKALIGVSVEMVVEFPHTRALCQPGRSFGSRCPSTTDQRGKQRLSQVVDLLPRDSWEGVENLDDFLGMLVFDKWTCNRDPRQVVYVRDQVKSTFRAVMIDQGFCFNYDKSHFPLLSARVGFYPERRAYENAHGIESFEPWLALLETAISEAEIRSCVNEVPREWCAGGPDLQQLATGLDERRKLVRKSIEQTLAEYPQFFPEQRCRIAPGIGSEYTHQTCLEEG